MSLRPVVSPGLAGCCTVLSTFGVLILSVIGYGFANNWEAFMGSAKDPEDGAAVATTCYIAALIYAAFILLSSLFRYDGAPDHWGLSGGDCAR